MPIAHQHKCIFVHIPKTGGTSIEKALGIKRWDSNILRSRRQRKIKNVLYAPQHFTCKMLENHPITKPHWKTYFKFAIVRHPYTKVLSEYFWIKKLKKGKGTGFQLNNFRKWLKGSCSLMKRDHTLKQSSFIYKGETLMVDYVGKFERLPEEFSFLKKKINIIGTLPHIHPSRRTNDTLSLLTQEDKNFIYKLYEEDFDKFKYIK